MLSHQGPPKTEVDIEAKRGKEKSKFHSPLEVDLRF